MNTEKQISSVLIVPFGAVNPKQGGGQRTAIIYEALVGLGPVTVVQLVQTTSPEKGPKVFFPQANDFVEIQANGFGTETASRLKRIFRKFGQFLTPGRDYAVQPAARTAFNDLCKDLHPDVIVSRYIRPYRTLGLDAADATPVAVDVDDRDDHRLMSYFNGICKISSLQWLYRGYLEATFGKQLDPWLNKAKHIWFAKDSDQMRLSTQVPILPNVPFLEDAPDGPPLGDRAPTLIFVASIGHFPNRAGIEWFLENCWSQIRAQVPTACIRLVGRDSWQSIEDRFGSLPGVEIVGAVDNLADEYASAKVAISPIFIGAGSQIKLIEACAYGLPVVGSSMSASGFGSEIATQLLLADTPDDFVEACVRLLTDDVEAATRGDALQALQRAAFSKAAAMQSIQQDIRNLLS